MDLTRRQVLLGTLSAFIVGCSDAWRNVTTESQSGSGTLIKALQNLIADSDAAASLGRAYLDAHQKYQTVDTLLNDIHRALLQHDADAAKQIDSDRVATALMEQVASEYAHGHVESVAGWLLSITEARIYGLAAMGAI